LRGGIALGLLDFRLGRCRRLLLLSTKLLTQGLLDPGETPAFLFRDLVTNALEFGAADFGAAPRAPFGSQFRPIGLVHVPPIRAFLGRCGGHSGSPARFLAPVQ
jgi:hypothetical protein